MVIDVEFYEKIRNMYSVEKCSQRDIAKKLNISRNTVRKYCEGTNVPWEHKTYERESTIINSKVEEFIKNCLIQDDEEGTKKQWHTAKRIYDRLVTETGFQGGESTVRRIVKTLKATVPKAFVPLSYEPGEAAQIDWGEAKIYLQGHSQKVMFFCLRLCFSCDIFVMAFPRANEESFLEALKAAFDHINGVPKKVIFDNARIAVKEGFGAHVRKEQLGYAALKAHYAFCTVYCNPAQGHEKGLVEGLVAYIRKNVFVPIPRVNNYDELNEILLKHCLSYRSHQIRKRKQTVGKDFEVEKQHLTPLPIYQFESSKCVSAIVNDFSLVRFDGNEYSVPNEFVGKTISVKGYGYRIDILYHNQKIATFQRSYDVNQVNYKLEHYINLLEQRPRSVMNAKPVKQQVCNELLQWGAKLPGGNRDVVKLLRLIVEYGHSTVKRAVDSIINAENPSIQMLRSELESSSKKYQRPSFLFSADDIKVKQMTLDIYDKLLRKEELM